MLTPIVDSLLNSRVIHPAPSPNEPLPPTLPGSAVPRKHVFGDISVSNRSIYITLSYLTVSTVHQLRKHAACFSFARFMHYVTMFALMTYICTTLSCNETCSTRTRSTIAIVSNSSFFFYFKIKKKEVFSHMRC